MKKLNICLLVLILYASLTKCAKILGIFPMPARSHFILGSALMKALAEKGHDVTIVSPYAEKNLPKNGSYRELILTGLVEAEEKRTKKMKMYEKESVNIFLVVSYIIQMVQKMTESALSHPNVKSLLNSDENFDIVIQTEVANHAYKGFASHFNAPLVLLSTVGSNYLVNILTGNPAPPSYIPEILLDYSDQMLFFERTINSLMNVYIKCLLNTYFLPNQEKLYKNVFPNGPDFYDIIYNISTVLLNSHTSLNQPVPHVSNMIDIGGFHVQPPKTLPLDLQKFLDDAKEGVIYFSMGSILRSSEMSIEKRNVFLKTFSKLKEKVLWKWEEDALPGLPQNVKIAKWLPQQDILAHHNVKLFISHGGLLSTVESIYHGIPVLAIPIAFDQKINAQKIVNEGFGLSMRYKDISEKSLSDNLNELLTNSQYTEAAKKRSALFHERLINPMDAAIYWVEYVIRHRGTPHLRVAGVELPWYKYMLLDVVAAVSVTVILGIYVFSKITQKVLSFCFKSKSRKLKKA